MPDDKPDLTAEAHRVATEAVDAADAFAKAAVNLPADTVRLGLDVLLATAEKLKGLVK